MKTRLSILCQIFGWQGGTIHQAQETAKHCLEEPIEDILNMTDHQFQQLTVKLALYYPSFKRYQAELTADYNSIYT